MTGDSGVLKRSVGGGGVAVLTLLFGGFSILLLYAVLAFWPPSFEANTIPVPKTEGTFLWISFSLDRERSLLLLVALAGATGACGHVIRSFIKYVGERRLVWSWVPSYLLIPLVGALLATLAYILIRAGLLNGGTNGSTIGNPFGFAAVAALVGLFSSQAAEKLKEVFETMFSKAPTGSDALETRTQASVRSFDPEEGSAGDEVTIVGSGLEAATQVVFGGGQASSAAWDKGAALLRTTVPVGAETGAISVEVDGASATSLDPFVVIGDLEEDDGADGAGTALPEEAATGSALAGAAGEGNGVGGPDAGAVTVVPAAVGSDVVPDPGMEAALDEALERAVPGASGPDADEGGSDGLG